MVKHGLESDGVIDRLFELLWKRDPFSDSAPQMRIPQTVVFRYCAPSAWYFTSVDGTIKRKSKAKLTCQHIEEEFLRHPSESNVVACYIYDISTEGVATKTIIEHLDPNGLKELLYNRKKTHNGILQKFTDPKGGQNHMVRALWSPKVFILERRMNKNRVADTRCDIYERAVTYEGPDFLSTTAPIRGATLPNAVHTIAHAIIQHVTAVTGDEVKITRMALNFKVDPNGRLCFLFASSIRLRDEKSRPLGGSASVTNADATNKPLEVGAVFAVPSHVRFTGTSTVSQPATFQRTCSCPVCQVPVEEQGLYEVFYKVLIAYEEELHRNGRVLRGAGDVTGSSGISNQAFAVPEVIRRLHPRITEADFAKYKSDPIFLFKSASVCEGCFVTFSTPQLGATHSHQLKECEAPGFVIDDAQSTARSRVSEDLIIGTQDLNPDRLKQRRRATMRRIESRREEVHVKEEEELRKRFQVKKVRSTSCPRLPTWCTKDLEHPLASQSSHPVDVGLHHPFLGPSLSGCLGMGVRVEASNRPRDARLWVPGHVDSRAFVESLRADGNAAPTSNNKSAGLSRAVSASFLPVSPSKVGLRGASNRFQQKAAPYLRELGAFMQRAEVVQGSSATFEYAHGQMEQAKLASNSGFDDGREDSCAMCMAGTPREGSCSSGRSSDFGDDIISTEFSGRPESGTRHPGGEYSPTSPQGNLKTGTSTPSTNTTRPPSRSTGRPGSRSTGNETWSRPSTSGVSGPSVRVASLSRPSSSPHLSGHHSQQRSGSGRQLGRPSSSPGVAVHRQSRGKEPPGLTRALEALALQEELQDDDEDAFIGSDAIHDEDWQLAGGGDTRGQPRPASQ
eukprot:gnl/MRDRNA2_/MRDRNA2_65999_c0_seq1.p1 gnl/MRDRNA2_/MRDRNA2_65999_c0~~gnl/MRDRNA2_/MRDRNA2_65999_c0_seq1.p1  ORF type:complete len:848 (+),score=129.61 gnl/MRDRNA2_/MRDRNA2_65999_c0_seq1:426-2969(+)